jgi:glycosyltransferase involved in cell wall biosynthesis
MNPLITVITPTTGTAQLADAVRSVDNQTYKNIQHLIVVDGVEHYENALDSIVGSRYASILTLPYNTGHSQYNGHRVYGAMTFIAEGEYLCFLDQDNWYDDNHIESLVNQLTRGNDWAYSLRKIVDQDGNYICNDDCESLGKWQSVIGDNFVDVNCFMIPKMAALEFAPYWYRRARHPNDQPEVDRILSAFMMAKSKTFDTNGQYTVNYRVASRADSVQDSFFIRGNNAMQQHLKGNYPWRKI